MAKGSSKLTGGGGTIQNGREKAVAAANKNPNTEDYENIGVRVVKKDGSTEYKAVSIQTTASIDDIEGVDYISGGGRYREGNIYRMLAGDAERNTINGKESYLSEPDFKEGKWTKTDKVPVMKVNANQHVLETTTGYGTKVNGETVYLQKRGNKFAINYKGNIANYGSANDTTLAKAKENVPKVMEMINGNSNIKKLASAHFEALNKNKGKISNKVWKEMDMSYIGSKL